MPLVALVNGERVESFSLDPQSWRDLKASYRARGLTMVCGKPGIPKTRSESGLQFFAHAAGSACTAHEGGPESSEHLAAKRIIAETARATGWSAQVEFPSADRTWIGDVMVARGRQRLIVEVQLSAHQPHQFTERQRRRERSGFNCVWFVANRNEWNAQHLPMVYMLSETEAGPMLHIPGTDDAWVDVPLAEGVHLMLTGELARRKRAQVARAEARRRAEEAATAAREKAEQARAERERAASEKRAAEQAEQRRAKEEKRARVAAAYAKRREARRAAWEQSTEFQQVTHMFPDEWPDWLNHTPRYGLRNADEVLLPVTEREWQGRLFVQHVMNIPVGAEVDLAPLWRGLGAMVANGSNQEKWAINDWLKRLDIEGVVRWTRSGKWGHWTRTSLHNPNAAESTSRPPAHLAAPQPSRLRTPPTAPAPQTIAPPALPKPPAFCRDCGGRLDPVLETSGFHVLCGPNRLSRKRVTFG